MFWNYLKVALVNLRKNKLYTLINIGGLTVGLCVYLLGNLIVDYERSHDEFFTNSERIFTIGTSILPSRDLSTTHVSMTYSALAPVLERELVDIEAIARIIRREYVVGNAEQAYYENVNITDPDLLKIFDFNYLHGDSTALDNPSKVILTDTAAIRYFGHTDVAGEILTLNNQHNFNVSAVISIPTNSHFHPDVDSDVEILLSMEGLASISDGMAQEGNWNNLGRGNFTYVLLPPSLNAAWFQTQLDNLFDRVTGENAKDTADGYVVSPINQANLATWDSVGFPAMDIIELLCLLVLLTAAANYTNLAIAQSLGRSREVGMRKVVGASRIQLFYQFMLESFLIVSVAMLCSVAILEIAIPAYNRWGGDTLALDFRQTLLWLAFIVTSVTLLSGVYPAWLITQANPVDALKDSARKGKKGSLIRSLMVGAQFAISSFMLAVVAIMFAQNKTVEEASYIFPRAEIFNLHRLEPNVERLYTLQQELENLPNIESVAFSSQIPYEQNDNSFRASLTPGDEASAVRMNEIMLTPEFFETYDIPIVAGRNFDRNRAADEFHRVRGESPAINVVVNELALRRLGFDSAEEAILQRLYSVEDNRKFSEAMIIGVVPTQNIQGFFSSEKPWIFMWSMDENWMDTGSIRISGGNFKQAIEDIEKVWNNVIPDYPMNGRFMDEDFNRIFLVMVGMNQFVGIFAFIAMTLAMIGLLGLASFYVTQKTREIGIRKTLGASSARIIQMLMWQLSKPVVLALLIALPAAYFASSQYLNMFAERIESPFLILIVSGLVSIGLALSSMTGLIYLAAKSKPIKALRHE